MKWFISLILLISFSGCSQPEKIASINDIKLGMQIFEVRDVHDKDLIPIAFESRQPYDLAQYRGWFKDGTKTHWRPFYVGLDITEDRIMPYKLTFEVYPPITKIQCQYIIAKNSITDPNEVSNMYSIIGLRPTRLIQVVLDESELHRQAIYDAAAIQAQAINNQTDHMMFEMQQQQILWNQQQMQFNKLP